MKKKVFLVFAAFIMAARSFADVGEVKLTPITNDESKGQDHRSVVPKVNYIINY